MKIRALALIIALATQHRLYAQRLTLPEAARRHAPEPLIQSTVGELIAVPLEQSLQGADLVVYGLIVQKGDSYLSADQMNIFTDFTIKPLRVIRQRITVASSTPVLQQTPPVVVKEWGGHLVIDGVEVSQINEDQRSLHVGEELVLLLAYDRRDQKYVIPSPSRAFSVQSSKITPFLKRAPLEKYEGMTVAQFEAEVHRLSR